MMPGNPHSMPSIATADEATEWDRGCLRIILVNCQHWRPPLGVLRMNRSFTARLRSLELCEPAMARAPEARSANPRSRKGEALDG
jgi:hypothetical protein